MRDLGKLQEQLASTSTITHALELNGQISKLKQENKNFEEINQRLNANSNDLTAQNESQLECIEALEKKLEDLKRLTGGREKRCIAEINRQKVSMDSLFEDLTLSRKQVGRLQSQLQSRRSSHNQCQQGNSSKESAYEKLPIKPLSHRSHSIANHEFGRQEHLLQTACDKRQEAHGGFFSSRGLSEKRVRELERENAKLKSSLVRLQAQYKEETYTSQKTIEGLLIQCQLKNGFKPSLNPNARTMSEDDDQPSIPSRSGGIPKSSRPGPPPRPSLPPKSGSLRRIRDYKLRKQEKEETMLDDTSCRTSPTCDSSISSFCSDQDSSIVLPPRRIASLPIASWRVHGLQQEEKVEVPEDDPSTSSASSFMGIRMSRFSTTKRSQSFRPPLTRFSSTRELRQENEAILLQHAAYKGGGDKELGAAQNFVNMQEPKQPTRSSSLRLWMSGRK